MTQLDPVFWAWDTRLPEEHRRALVPKRFRVVFLALNDRQVVYHVCTCLDARKALAMAAGVHAESKNPADSRIYEVQEVVFLGSAEPQTTDLVDRSEW